MTDGARERLVDGWNRRIIGYLREVEDGTGSLDGLIDHVIEREPNPPAPDRETVAYELVHVHLPTLAEYGVVEFDERTETIRYRSHLGRVIDEFES